MPRTMTSAMLAAIKATGLLPAMFVSASFANETVYIWTGLGNITWNGQTWSGVGSILGISVAEDAATVEARGIVLTLSGLNPTLLGEALGQYQIGLPVTVYLGFFSAGALIADPVVSWAGRMDAPAISVEPSTATITINCESRLVELNNAIDRRLTHQDAQMDHPGDLGFQFVDGLQEQTLFWGRYPATGANI